MNKIYLFILAASMLAISNLASCELSSAKKNAVSEGENGGSGGYEPGSGGGARAESGSGSLEPDEPCEPVSEPGITVIQEDETGFAAVDGKILPREGSTSVTGYTCTGFADPDSGVGTSIGWSIEAQTAGSYSLVWRYAFGGDENNARDARLLVNGDVSTDEIVFPYTGAWDTWQETDPVEVELAEGKNFILLEALYEGGLANFDYFKVLGEGITGTTASFSLTVDQNDSDAGSISVSPEQDFYEAGTQVTLTAEANDGFFFQSWSGDVSSAESEFTFAISDNTEVTALFLPEGTEQDPELVGYAGVQDDDGTPYLVTGGSLGQSVEASTLGELKEYLGSDEPYVVSFAGLIEGADVIEIASHKTLRGIGDSAHLMGIELQVSEARNVIIQNVAVSHVIAEGSGEANDAIVLSGAKNVWVDRCELFSDRENGKDYYDGLLEIKNEAAFVTVSRTVFHDHFKVSLISSGDEQVGDTAIRATYHHNYFYNCGSRLPSIRFGKAHVFNNYYLDNTSGSGINSRMGAVVRAEGNYFENTKDPIGFQDSPMTGYWDLGEGNIYDSCTGSQPTESTGSLTPPYDYELDEASEVPAIVVEAAGVGRL